MNVMFKSIIFDMDGTLTKPILDFVQIRKEIEIPRGDIALEIAKLDADGQRKAWGIIEKHEENALKYVKLQKGTAELIHKCRENNIKIATLTRNILKSVHFLMEKYSLVFDEIITREFPYLKPHPQPILHLLDIWELPPESCLMVGDYIHDIECGNSAGAKTCFFHNKDTPFYGENANYTVSSMQELDKIIFTKCQ